MSKPLPSLVWPEPLSHFRREKVVYIPCDLPSGLIKKHLHKKAIRVKTSEWGTLFLLNDKNILFQAMGAPLAVMTLERLAASGAQEILVLGFCGSLNPRFPIASIVSVTKAHADEGTSRHYMPRKKYFHASLNSRTAVENVLAAGRLPFLKGTAVSTDAPFRETPAWLRTMQAKGCDIVDMETSAVFAFALYRRIPAASLLMVSDELFTGTWRHHNFFDLEYEERVRACFFPFL